MKRYIIYALLGCALVLGSCAKDFDTDSPAPVVPDNQEGIIPMSLTMSGEQAATRTDMVGNRVLWNENDRLGIFSPEAYYEWKMSFLPDNLYYNNPVNNVCMEIGSGAGSAAATFKISSVYEGDTPEYTGRWGWNTKSEQLNFYMYYPYQEAAKAATKPTALPFTLPSAQKQSGSDNTGRFSEYDLVYASTVLDLPAEAADKSVIEDNLIFDFDHAFAVLKITVGNYTAGAATVTGVRLASGDGQPLAGNFTLDLTTGSLTSGQTIDASGAVVEGVSSSSVTTTFDEGVEVARYQSAVLYLFVNPVDLTATDTNVLTVYTTDGYQQFAFKASRAFEPGKIYTRSLTVRELETYPTATLDFESVDAKYLAGQTSYGANLYNAEKDKTSYEGDQFISYTDPATGLVIGINDYNDTYVTMSTYKSFFGGGLAISQWNDMTQNSYLNQCSVYCKDASTGKGGADGSSTFAVAYGYDDGSAYSTDNRSSFYFAEAGREAVISSLCVCNTTYVHLCLKDGNSFSTPMSYDKNDYFRVTFTGIDAAGAQTGSVAYYLADFRTESAPGIAEGWNKVDLSPLGSVHKVVINFEGSDSGEYGLNTPAYCAIDNIEVRFTSVE
ncbi:MAG: DUF4465 domain-containing protein [Alistipes sp.]|nr:DUF4465 domain-containing protein [Alistipes sp.]